MPTLRATDTLVILRELTEAAEAIAVAMALVNAADARGLILDDASPVKVQLLKAHAAAIYGRDWLMKTPGLIADTEAEPVTLPVAAE